MFGGAAFVLFYALISIVIGVPALMAEFALGRHTRRGPVGAFAAGGFPFGVSGRLVFLCRGRRRHRLLHGRHRLGAVLRRLRSWRSRRGPRSTRPRFCRRTTGSSAMSFVLQMACTGADHRSRAPS